MSQRSLLAFGISQKRKADSESERTVSSDQPAQKKCKTNSGSGSASNSRVFQPQWWTGSSMMRRQSVCSAEHECINLVSKVTCLHVPLAAKSPTSKAD